jgi:putative sterol carrier protein
MNARDLLEKLPAAFDAERAGDLKAVVQYDLAEPTYQVIEGGGVRTLPGRAEAPDLTLKISDDDLVALFRGTLSPAVAFMTGRVRMEGDVRLAQQLVDLVDQERLRSIT